MELATTYLGLSLKSPLVPSASPFSEDIDNIKRMEDAGAGAVVLHSLFEEQLRLDRHELHLHTTAHTDSFPEALSFFPQPDEFRVGPEAYLNHIRKAKASVHIPIIASLNGSRLGRWIDYAAQIEQAGADALELNVYYLPTDLELSSGSVEKNYFDILREVKAKTKLPVAMKLSPYFSNLAYIAKRLDDSGVNALVLFNRFYQPDIDLESLEIRADLNLSTHQAMRLPLRWIAILYGRIGCNLAATGGIHLAEDAIKMIMAGASVTMLCAVLIKRGIDQIRVIEQGMREWLAEHEYESIAQMQGSMSQIRSGDPSAFERAQYVRILQRLPFRQVEGLSSSGPKKENSIAQDLNESIRRMGVQPEEEGGA